MTMNPSLRNTCITPLKTILLDLPTEVLQNILDFASRDIERRQLYKYRLVNRYFEIQINRLCWKRRCWIKQDPWTTNLAPNSHEAFIYSEDCTVESELRTAISTFLRSSQSIVNDLQIDLRLAMAVLMNTEELIVEGSQQKGIQEKAEFPITESDGLIEKYTDPASRDRFLKIVDLLVSTVCCVSGSGLNCSNWYPRKVMDDLEYDSRQHWSDRSSDLGYVPNLDWALATTAFVGNMSAFKAILNNFNNSDKTLQLSPQYSYRNIHQPWVTYRHPTSGPTWVSALTVAIRKNNYELAILLLETCDNLVNEYTLVPPHENALETACQQGSLQMVDLVLDPRWGLDYASWHAYYAVQNAARCSCLREGPTDCDERIAIIHTLLPLLSPERDCQKLKNEVLKQACKWGCMSLVRMLVEDLDAQPANFDGVALSAAAMHGHVEIMEYLLNRTTRHLSPFFPAYMIEFMETGADRDMMVYLEGTKSFILSYGALEPAKAQYLLIAAKKRNCPKVVDLLRRGGVSD